MSPTTDTRRQTPRSQTQLAPPSPSPATHNLQACVHHLVPACTSEAVQVQALVPQVSQSWSKSARGDADSSTPSPHPCSQISASTDTARWALQRCHRNAVYRLESW